MPRPLLQQQEKQQYQQQKVKKGSKISRSLQKIIRSMFRSKSSSSKVYRVEEKSDDDGLYLVYDRKGVLKTIPEVPEMAADYLEISQEFDSKVRRTVSERFTSTSISLSLLTPIPIPPTFHGMTWEEVEEADDDFHTLWRFHYMVLFAAHRRSCLRMLAEDAVLAEDEKAGKSSEKYCRYPAKD
ncbi:hypothetical protein GIB67_042830 [Kingdonia uniflora]|uniref:Uncharacterized protein n=1 Tax=Kingdonia uniflora TaxID=39325 RepID=A0A7J7N653_9MAGN|nr:hypothetical protein GIB67_042830 [Kingdonia uniflora]